MIARAAKAVALLALVTALPALAAEPRFFRFEGAKDFLEGELLGLSVDSDGRVRLAPAAKLLHDTQAPFAWCLVSDGKDTVYAGTGNDGKVWKIAGGKASVLFDAPELEVHALALGKDGRLYVGTSPDGKVYAVDGEGGSTTVFDPADKYIWALAFDALGRLLVATGGEGRVYRVDAKGAPSTLLQTAETHVLSLAADAKGTVYAGSAPSGILYRLDSTGDASGKVFVVNDSPYREVKSLALGRDGSLYAALVDGKPAPDEAGSPRTASPPETMPPTASVEVTVTEAGTGTPLGGTAGQGAPPPAAGPAKGALVRVLPGGEIDTLWTSSEDTPQAIAASDDGVLVATGGKGKLYRIRDDRSFTLAAVLPADQLTGLASRGGSAAFVAASGAGRVFALGDTPGDRGTFVSKPRDAETVSAWGRIRWDADVPAGTELHLQTRSGNTQAPDATWSDWSPPYQDKEGQPIASEKARFVQLKATFVGKDGRSPVLEALGAAYLQRNLRPQVPQITVHPPGEVFQKPISVTGEPEILGLDPVPGPPPGTPRGAAMPAPTAFSRKMYERGLQTFSWRAEDSNGDTLSFDVFYRAVGESRFRLLRRGLTEPVLAWDTATVPNGRYLVKVVASDAPSNPAGLALTGDKESTPFDVDNTPPTISASLAPQSPPRIRATARDDASALRKAEYSVDGGRWEEVHPLDGISDGREEAYEFALPVLPGPGPHVVVVRAADLLGNLASARVEVP